MDCRGHDTRVNIVNEYNVTPIAHFPVYGDEVIRSDAGGDITDSYFLFDCVHKETGEKDGICCGEPTARDFAELLHVTLPRIDNPFREEGLGGGENGGGVHDMRWEPMKRQLYNATMLFIMSLKGRRNDIAFKKIVVFRQESNIRPKLSEIKTINTLYRQYNRTAREVINNLAEEGRTKEYRFDLLTTALMERGIEQYFEI